MSNYETLSFSPAAKGWPSFYTFNPDWMIGMNQFFYTFKGGNLFVHNKNAERNRYYGTYSPSILRSVFNDMPIDNKLFKTIAIEGTSSWAATLKSDIQESGFIEQAWFEKKEGSFFAFVRNSGDIPADLTEYPLRSVNGIGRSLSITGTNDNPIINFAVTISIGSIISVGDLLYFAPPPYSNPVLAGRVSAVDVDLPNGINRLLVDATIPNVTKPIPLQTPYFMFIKNSVAESHGILGHYAVFELTNSDVTPVELFVVNSEVMKSYP
jgi:hypothetical protein